MTRRIRTERPSDEDIREAVQRNESGGAQRVRQHEEQTRRAAVEQLRKGQR